MKNFIKLFEQQFNDLPNSGYKTQLGKYGKEVLESIINKSILSLIAEITITEQTPSFKYDEVGKNRTVPVMITLSSDLGVLKELVYKMLPINAKTKEDSDLAIEKAVNIINNTFMNYVLSDCNISIELPKEKIFQKRENTRILIIGNDLLGLDYPLSPTVDNTNLKFIGNSLESDLVFHSCYIPANTVYAIDLGADKLIEYSIKDALNVFNNKFIHGATMKVINPEIIRKYVVK